MHSSFLVLPQVKNQRLTAPEQAAALGVVLIDSEAAWRGEEAAFRDFSCKTPSLAVSGPFSALFQATLLTIFTPFFVVQFHAFPK